MAGKGRKQQTHDDEGRKEREESCQAGALPQERCCISSLRFARVSMFLLFKVLPLARFVHADAKCCSWRKLSKLVGSLGRGGDSRRLQENHCSNGEEVVGQTNADEHKSKTKSVFAFLAGHCREFC